MAKDFMSLTGANQKQSQLEALKKIGDVSFGVDGGRMVLNGTNLSVFEGDVENFKKSGLGGYNTEQLETVFGALDVNADGKLDMEELQAFAALGTDKNNAIVDDKNIIDETDFQALYEMAQGYVEEALDAADNEVNTTANTNTSVSPRTSTAATANTSTTTTQTEATQTETTEVNRTQPTINDRDAGALATELYSAMKGWGTDEETVNRILLQSGYNSADIVKIMDAYENKYGESLMSWIQDDFSGKEETALREALYEATAQQALESVGWQSTNDIPENVADTADKMYYALEEGNDDAAMAAFNKLPDSQKTQVMLALQLLHPDKSAMTRITQNVYGPGKEDKYVDNLLNSMKNVAHENPAPEVEAETAKAETTTLEDRATINDREAGAAAAELYTAMKGWGTDEETVDRILKESGYSTADIVKIMDAFENKYGASLMNWIQDDYSGKEETELREILYNASATEAALSSGWQSTNDIPENVANTADKLYYALEEGNDDAAMAAYNKLPDSQKAQVMLALQLLHPDKSAMTRITQNVYGPGKEDKYVDNVLKSLVNMAKG